MPTLTQPGCASSNSIVDASGVGFGTARTQRSVSQEGGVGPTPTGVCWEKSPKPITVTASGIESPFKSYEKTRSYVRSPTRLLASTVTFTPDVPPAGTVTLPVSGTPGARPFNRKLAIA